MLLDFLLYRKQYSGSSTVAAPCYIPIMYKSSPFFTPTPTPTFVFVFLCFLNSHPNECEMPVGHLGGRACQHNHTGHLPPGRVNTQSGSILPPPLQVSTSTGAIQAPRLPTISGHLIIASQAPLSPESRLQLSHTLWTSLMTSLIA